MQLIKFINNPFDLLDWSLEFPELKFPDLQELKQSGKGEYTETVKEEGDYVTVESKYESFDGKQKYYKTEVRPRNASELKEKFAKKAELRKLMVQAANKQDFETAAKYRDELKSLSNKK